MTKHSFTAAERWAVFVAHGPKCYLCTRPIDFASMEVDHIIPESLLDAPVELASVVASYGLGASFDVNSFENWQPSCDRCNREKSDTAFVAVPIIAAQLERAKGRAPQAREIERRTISDRRIGSAIAQIEVALTAGDMDADRLQPLIQAYLDANPDAGRAILREQLDRRSRRGRSDMGFQLMPEPLLELRLTPFAKVVYRSTGFWIVPTRDPDATEQSEGER